MKIIIVFSLFVGTMFALESQLYPSHLQNFLEPLKARRTDLATELLKSTPTTPQTRSRRSWDQSSFEDEREKLLEKSQERRNSHFNQMEARLAVRKARAKSKKLTQSLIIQSNPATYFVASYCDGILPLSGSYYPLDFCFSTWGGSYQYVQSVINNQVSLWENYFFSPDCSGDPTFDYQLFSNLTSSCFDSTIIANIVSTSELPGGLLTNYYNSLPDGSYDCSVPSSVYFDAPTCLFFGCGYSLGFSCSANLTLNEVNGISIYSDGPDCSVNPFGSYSYTFSPAICTNQTYFSYSCVDSPILTNVIENPPSIPNSSEPLNYVQYTTTTASSGQSGTYYPLNTCTNGWDESFEMKALEKDGMVSLYNYNYCSVMDCSGDPLVTLVSSLPNSTQLNTYSASIVDQSGLPEGYLIYYLQYNSQTNLYECDNPTEVIFEDGCQYESPTNSYRVQCGFEGNTIVLVFDYYNSADCSIGTQYQQSNMTAVDPECHTNSFIYYACTNPVFNQQATSSPSLNPTVLPPTVNPTASPSSPSSALQVFVLGQYNFQTNQPNSDNDHGQTRLACDSSDGPSSPPIGYYFPLNYCFSNGEQASYQYSSTNYGSFLSLSMSYYGSMDCSGSGVTSQVVSRVSSTCTGIVYDPRTTFQPVYYGTGAVIPMDQIPEGVITDSYPCEAGSGCNSYSCSQFETRKVVRTGLCVGSPGQTLSFSASCEPNSVTYNQFLGGSPCSSSSVVHINIEYPDHLCLSSNSSSSSSPSSSSQYANYCTQQAK